MANVPLIQNGVNIEDIKSELENFPTQGFSRYVSSPDTRDVNTSPIDVPKGVTFDFKRGTVIGISSPPGTGYVGLMTFRPYGSTSDFTGGPVHQLAFLGNGALQKRYSTGNTTWSAWVAV